jgi:hypothetical protein
MTKLLILLTVGTVVSGHPVYAQRIGDTPMPGPVYMSPAPSVQIPTIPTLPSTAPSIPSTSLAPAATIPSVALPTAPPTRMVSPCQRPQDCPDRSASQEARRRFAKCVAKSKMGPDTLNTKTLEDCALGIMSPSKFTAFTQCLARRETAWGCYQQAYR